jgi:hypothetical protein
MQIKRKKIFFKIFLSKKLIKKARKKTWRHLTSEGQPDKSAVHLFILFLTKKHRYLRKLVLNFLEEKLILITSLSFVSNPFGCCVYCRLKRAF